MKNFFYFSAAMYTFGIALMVFGAVVWPMPGDPTPVIVQQGTALALGMLILVVALTSFGFGLWDKYVLKDSAAPHPAPKP